MVLHQSMLCCSLQKRGRLSGKRLAGVVRHAFAFATGEEATLALSLATIGLAAIAFASKGSEALSTLSFEALEGTKGIGAQGGTNVCCTWAEISLGDSLEAPLPHGTVDLVDQLGLVQVVLREEHLLGTRDTARNGQFLANVLHLDGQLRAKLPGLLQER